MLFVFVNKLKKVSSIYTDNLAVQTSLDTYKDFIKTVKNMADSTQKEEEKERTMKSTNGVPI